ncbi:MAG: F0F1 ATP synthase subunit B [Ignavibacteria bacterium]|nr:F0F1 ATP synthase subunit B [Ignavibacteria bacterium]
MDSLLNVNPGLMFWTILNFLIFLFLLIKFGAKPISNSLKAREEHIEQNIKNAEKLNQEAQQLLNETQQKLKDAHSEMMNIIQKGKQQADELIRKATEEAEKIRKEKLDEATREINRSKEAALFELKKEVANLVIQATEKLLGEKLDEQKHIELINSYIDKIPKN